jgi:hypothetical protein
MVVNLTGITANGAVTIYFISVADYLISFFPGHIKIPFVQNTMLHTNSLAAPQTDQVVVMVLDQLKPAGFTILEVYLN